MSDSNRAVGMFRDGQCDRAEQSGFEAATTTRSDGDEVGVSAEFDQCGPGRPFDEQSADGRIGPITALGNGPIEQALRHGPTSFAIDGVHYAQIRPVDRRLLARPIHSCPGCARTVDTDDYPSYSTHPRTSHDNDWTWASARRGASY